VSNSNNPLRLNIGFIIHQSIGYYRDFPFESPIIHLKPDLDLQNLIGTVRVTRTAQGLLVQGKLRAVTPAECVRCLADFVQPLEIDFTELYAFSSNSVTESGLYVPENGLLDLAPLIRDEMYLAIPISPVCKPDCKGLCPICGENLNETTCHHEEEAIDLRLNNLKELFQKGQDLS
jgi:DUF177 domain-containing protein